MLTGCFRTSLSNFRSLSNLRKNTHIDRKINGSVGKLILNGGFRINSDNSIDNGVQNSMIINNLSSARNANKQSASPNGMSVTRYDSFKIPTILAIMNEIAEI